MIEDVGHDFSEHFCAQCRKAIGSLSGVAGVMPPCPHCGEKPWHVVGSSPAPVTGAAERMGYLRCERHNEAVEGDE